MLGPTLLFVVIVLTTRAFQAYGEVDLLTGGGPRPQDSTTTITYLTYGQESIIINNDGLQAAVAVLLFVVLLVLSLLQLRGDREAGPLWQLRTSTSSRRAAGVWPARYVLLAAVAVVVLFPVYTTVIARPQARRQGAPDTRWCRTSFTLDGFSDAWTEGHLGRYLLNSFVVAVVVTIAQLVTSVLSAYAFAMLDFPGRGVLFVVFLATLLVPLEATLVVNRRTVDSLGWLNATRAWRCRSWPPRSARS